MVRYGLLIIALLMLGCGEGAKIIPPTNPVTIEKPGKDSKAEKRAALPTLPSTPKTPAGTTPANKTPPGKAPLKR